MILKRNRGKLRIGTTNGTRNLDPEFTTIRYDEFFASALNSHLSVSGFGALSAPVVFRHFSRFSRETWAPGLLPAFIYDQNSRILTCSASPSLHRAPQDPWKGRKAFTSLSLKNSCILLDKKGVSGYLRFMKNHRRCQNRKFKFKFKFTEDVKTENSKKILSTNRNPRLLNPEDVQGI